MVWSLILFHIASMSALMVGFEFIYLPCGFLPSHYPSTSNLLSSFHSTFYRRHHFFTPSVCTFRYVFTLRSHQIDVLSIFKSLRLLLPRFFFKLSSFVASVSPDILHYISCLRWHACASTTFLRLRWTVFLAQLWPKFRVQIRYIDNHSRKKNEGNEWSENGNHIAAAWDLEEELPTLTNPMENGRKSEVTREKNRKCKIEEIKGIFSSSVLAIDIEFHEKKEIFFFSGIFAIGSDFYYLLCLSGGSPHWIRFFRSCKTELISLYFLILFVRVLNLQICCVWQMNPRIGDIDC